jgi:hypothetical protein
MIDYTLIRAIADANIECLGGRSYRPHLFYFFYETVALFKFIREHQDRFRVYVDLPDTHPIREILKVEAVKIVVDRWEARATSPVPMEVSINHLVESSYAFIRWRLNHINDHTPEELADFYDELILAGAEFKAQSRRKDRPGQHPAEHKDD